MNLERLVQDGKQKLLDVSGKQKRLKQGHAPLIPQAEGSKKDRLLIHVGQLVTGDVFEHQSFVNFVGKMREIVGFEDRPNGPSNALPYARHGIKCYLELNVEDNASSIDIVRKEMGNRSGFYRRALFLEHWQEPYGFGLKMATWPAYPSDITEIKHLLNSDNEIAFTKDADLPPYHGKGGVVWTRTPLPANIVQHFCRNIVEQLQALPRNYTFVPGEIIDERSKTLKERFLDRYFRSS